MKNILIYGFTIGRKTGRGRLAGSPDASSGSLNTFIGYAAGEDNITGFGNVFLGFKAGYNETGSNKLYIANSSVTTLIYGDFSTGRVGIGTIAPTYQFQLSSDSAAKPGTNTWTVASDERVKTDIRPFADGLDTILRIDPVWYKYNGKGGLAADGKDNVGIIAQDIKKVAPYTVSSYYDKLNPDDAEDTELLNFNSGALTFTTINAIKELNNKIEMLEMANKALEKRIEALEAK